MCIRDRPVIASLQVRVVLNKADNVESQKLMRVYGALMWSLGGIVCSPEVPRVFVGSFIDEPWVFDGLSSLMDAEENDLVKELDSLPEDNVMRKINEIARRASLVKVHVHLLSHMRDCVTSKWMGRKQAQEWVCTPDGMRQCYEAVEQQQGLSRGDFPSGEKLARKLIEYDFNALYKPASRSIKMKLLQELIDEDIPKLIKQLTQLQKRQKGSATRPSFKPIRKKRPYPPDATDQPATSALDRSQLGSSRLGSYAAAWAPSALQRAAAPTMNAEGGTLPVAPPQLPPPAMAAPAPPPPSSMTLPADAEQPPSAAAETGEPIEEQSESEPVASSEAEQMDAESDAVVESEVEPPPPP
eukprot:7087446-Prymnesium_polylepis.1